MRRHIRVIDRARLLQFRSVFDHVRSDCRRTTPACDPSFGPTARSAHAILKSAPSGSGGFSDRRHCHGRHDRGVGCRGFPPRRGERPRWRDLLVLCGHRLARQHRVGVPPVRAWQESECDPYRHHRAHSELTMCDRWKACSKAGGWPAGEQLVGLISCPRLARPWAWSWHARGPAQATRSGEAVAF